MVDYREILRLQSLGHNITQIAGSLRSDILENLGHRHYGSPAYQLFKELQLTILALQYPDSGKLSTDVPDVDTGIDWLVYLAQYSLQCQAQSRFVVRSRLDIVENTEIMAGPNQSFYCGTL